MKSAYNECYWRARPIAMARDKYRCQTCGASDKTSRLETHHKFPESYAKDRAGTLTEDDLLTVCEWCHEAITSSIQERRNANVSIHRQPVLPSNISLDRDSDYVSNFESKIDWGQSPLATQWRPKRSDEPVVPEDQTVLRQKGQDRSGLRDDGKIRMEWVSLLEL